MLTREDYVLLVRDMLVESIKKDNYIEFRMITYLESAKTPFLLEGTDVFISQKDAQNFAGARINQDIITHSPYYALSALQDNDVSSATMQCLLQGVPSINDYLTFYYVYAVAAEYKTATIVSWCPVTNEIRVVNINGSWFRGKLGIIAGYAHESELMYQAYKQNKITVTELYKWYYRYASSILTLLEHTVMTIPYTPPKELIMNLGTQRVYVEDLMTVLKKLTSTSQRVE